MTRNASKIQIFKKDQIIFDLRQKIKSKTPFSLIRFGDGGLKYINSILNNKEEQLKMICSREGIPISKSNEILEAWSFFANKADYIDSPSVYFSRSLFWGRTKNKLKKISTETKALLKNWKEIYSSINITNDRYCNPEVNFLMILNQENNLLNILENRRVCFITSCDCSNEISDKLLRKFKITALKIIKIAGWNENQYENSFVQTIKKIDELSEKYDIWLVGAGELGRIYTGYIKYRNGIAIDIGSVFDYWYDGIVPTRLIPFLKKDKDNSFLVGFTALGERYKTKI